MKITKTSLYTNKRNTMDVNITQAEYDCWKNGGDIDTCMPNITLEEREFLTTGALPEEVDAMYEDDDGLDFDDKFRDNHF